MFPPGSNRSQQLGKYYDGGIIYYTPLGFSGQNVSESHRRVKGRYKTGGPWKMWKQTVENTPTEELVVYVNSSSVHYRGRFQCTASYSSSRQPPSGWNSLSNLNSMASSLENRGAEAWNAMRPDLPDFSLATEIMELKDMPRFLKDQTRRIRDLANREYRKRYKRRPPSKYAQYHLELQFGWLPILRSILGFAETMRNKDSLLQQLIRDNGRPKRRKRNLTEAANNNDTGYKTGSFNTGWGVDVSPLLPTGCYGQTSRSSGSNTLTSKTWCEGQFRYLLPPGPRNRAWKRMMKRRIFGGRLTASDAYNIIPWSWMVDYFTDLGQFVQAVSPGVADKLICDYAYLMRTIEYAFDTTATISIRNGPNTYKHVSCRRRVWQTRKVRVEATPFGFGVKQTDLTPNQLSILGALGLSKL